MESLFMMEMFRKVQNGVESEKVIRVKGNVFVVLLEQIGVKGTCMRKSMRTVKAMAAIMTIDGRSWFELEWMFEQRCKQTSMRPILGFENCREICLKEG
jgi:hypothetical protein